MNNENQPKSRDEWFALIDEQASGRLSQTEFCKHHNLIPCRFSYYKKLRAPTQVTSSFSPVKVIQELPISSGNIKVDLPNGFCCHVPSNISADKLKVLIGTLVLC